MDIFKEYEPALLDHLLYLIRDGSANDQPVSDTYLLSKVTGTIPDRIALLSVLADINKFDPYLIEEGKFVAGEGNYRHAGKGLEIFLESGGFEGIVEGEQIKQHQLREREKLELENLQTSIASGRAAVESEKHAKSSKYAAWVACGVSVLAILASIGITWWQGAQNEDLKRRIEVLEKERPIWDTLIIKDSSSIGKNLERQ